MTTEFIDIKDYNYRVIMRVREALGYFDNIEVQNNELQQDSSVNFKKVQGGEEWNYNNYKM